MPGHIATSRPARQVLLLSSDPAWAIAAESAVDRSAGESLAFAASGTDALKTLVAPAHGLSHLLLEPLAAGSYVNDLLSVTAGEANSQVELIVLGVADGLTSQPGMPRARTPGELAATLDMPRPSRPSPPGLSNSDIAAALGTADLECRFQPIVRLADRRAAGMEALARLRLAEHGTIAPDLFIPQIERAGMSLGLTDAMAQGAMASVDPAFLDQNDLFLAINLPLDVLLIPEALARMETHRTLFQIPSHRILIELTESRPVRDIPALADAVQRWHDGGYRVAIDDMGPEMVNQVELFDLPFTMVKLDKQIVLRSETDCAARRYLQRTVDNAHSRGLHVIAEGIENEAMWDHMRGMGVEYGQGFLMARPMPPAALPLWLEVWSAQAIGSSPTPT